MYTSLKLENHCYGIPSFANLHRRQSHSFCRCDGRQSLSRKLIISSVQKVWRTVCGGKYQVEGQARVTESKLILLIQLDFDRHKYGNVRIGLFFDVCIYHNQVDIGLLIILEIDQLSFERQPILIWSRPWF